MPEIVTCPDCQRTLRVPDNLLGKKVKCPGCQGMFTAGGNGAGAPVVRPEDVPPPPPPREDYPPPRPGRREDRYAEERSSRRRDDDYDDRPARRRDDDYDDRPGRRRDDDYDDRGPRQRDDHDDDYRRVSPREGWRKVALGLQLNIIGGWVWIGGSVLMMLGLMLSFILALAGGQGMMSAMTPQGVHAASGTVFAAGMVVMLGLIVMSICMFAELVLRVTGFGLCMAVPVRRNTGLRTLAIVALALGGVEGLIRLASTATQMVGPRDHVLGPAAYVVGNPFAYTGGGLFTLAAVILFLIFARNLSYALRDRKLGDQFLSILITYAVLYFISYVTICSVFFAFWATFFGSFGSSANQAASSVGVWAVVSMVITAILFLAYIGVEVWLIMSLQRLREDARSFRDTV